MIEQGIYFAIGCIVTALLAMAFAPIYWNRALRLTRQRLRLQVPLSMQEILADRDQLRAEFAVKRVRLEQAVDRVHAGKAKDMAELGRRTMEAADLAAKLKTAKDLETSQDREIQLLLREAAEVGAETGSLHMALHDAFQRIEHLTREFDGLVRERQALRDETQERRTTIASLETRAMGLEMRLLDAERAHAAKEKRSEAALRSRLEAAMSQATRHEASALSFQRERDEAKSHLRTIEHDLDAALERERGANLQRSLEVGKGGERVTRERLDLLQAENAALQTALAAAQQGGSARSDDDDAGLRASIHSLGLAVALLSREKREPKSSDGATSRPRDLEPSVADVSSSAV